MISFCVCTRKRPELYKRMCLSVLNTASNPEDIEFVSYRDYDDDSAYEFVGNHKEIVGERVGQHIGFNECQKVATGPIYWFGTDDLLFQSPGWDEKVKDAFNQYSDKILLVYINDHYHRSRFGRMGFLHKNWIDTVGYIMPPNMIRRGDCWINEVARKIDRNYYINGAGYQNLDIRTDETHKEVSAKAVATQCLKKYRSKEMKEAREKDAQLLQEFINNHGT